jgi:dienelactone hydrolase
MRFNRFTKAMVVAAAAGLALAPSSHAADPVVGVDARCFADAGHPDPMVNAAGVPTNPVWIQRDTINQYCATLRLRDQAASPAFGVGNLSVGANLFADQAAQQAGDLPGGHVHGGVTTLVPGSLGADPFRDLSAWEKQTKGTAKPVVFTSSNGAQLRGHVFTPPPSVPKPKGGYPGIVITDGSVQAYENLYYWAAEGLAQYGYVVLTYDVQGQGDSDLLPKDCTPTACKGVPYQQNYNFYQGAEDSLSWFDSKANPLFASLDRTKLGVAGHSLGAAAVSWVGQCDARVKTIVAWDDLQPIDITKCAANVTVPQQYQAKKLHAPALATTNDYEFNVQPATHVPNPHGDTNAGGGAGDRGYQSLAKAGVDSQLVSFRNGTHLTYSYIPLVLPANELGERFAFYYTLAWFDQYLRGGTNPFTAQSALSRLTALGTYDGSADSNSLGQVSIGTGTFDPTTGASASKGNVPYLIKGISIPNSLSFYYFSAYRLTDPKTHQVRTCTDLLARCPRVTPAVP